MLLLLLHDLTLLRLHHLLYNYSRLQLGLFFVVIRGLAVNLPPGFGSSICISTKWSAIHTPEFTIEIKESSLRIVSLLIQ